jgi:hypothetical protein
MTIAESSQRSPTFRPADRTVGSADNWFGWDIRAIWSSCPAVAATEATLAAAEAGAVNSPAPQDNSSQ